MLVICTKLKVSCTSPLLSALVCETFACVKGLVCETPTMMSDMAYRKFLTAVRILPARSSKKLTPPSPGFPSGLDQDALLTVEEGDADTIVFLKDSKWMEAGRKGNTETTPTPVFVPVEPFLTPSKLANIMLSPGESPLPKLRASQRKSESSGAKQAVVNSEVQRTPLNRRRLKFKFDRVLDENSTQGDVSELICANAAVQSTLKGRDFSVFVNGPLSSQLLSGFEGSLGVIISCFIAVREISARVPEAPIVIIAYSAIGIDLDTEKVVDLLADLGELHVKENRRGCYDVVDRKYLTVESVDDVS
jgi:hypothetical protein